MSSKHPNKKAKPGRKQTASKRHAENANPPMPPPGTTELQIPPPEGNSNHSRNQKKHWIDYAVFGVQTLGFLGLVAYCVITYGIYCANHKAAIAAKSAADTAANTLALSERPWVSLANISIISPLTFDPQTKNGTMTISYALKNSGHSPAMHVMWHSKIISVYQKLGMVEEIRNAQKAFCGPLRDRPWELMDSTIFPGDSTYKRTEDVSIYGRDVSAFLAANGGKNIEPFLIACVDYQTSFEKAHHQSRYVFELATPVLDKRFTRPLFRAINVGIIPEGAHPELRLIYFSQSAD